jgi:hypothetical protein
MKADPIAQSLPIDSQCSAAAMVMSVNGCRRKPRAVLSDAQGPAPAFKTEEWPGALGASPGGGRVAGVTERISV